MAQGSTKAPQDILTELGVDDLYSFIGVELQATDKEVQNKPIDNLLCTCIVSSHISPLRSPVRIGRRL